MIGYERRKYEVVHSDKKVDIVARSWAFLYTYAHID